jgi:glycerate kinase
VVAPAAFKGALSAAGAARAIAAGMRLVPGVVTDEVPIADGGEGTLDALVAARGGRTRTFTVADPLGRPVEAPLGLLPGGVAVVELALASGYERLADRERDPEVTTTRGTGELVRAALDLGATRIIVCVGGSATNDGGLGIALALGAAALDDAGAQLEGRGGELARVARLDLAGLDPRLQDVAIQVACDVDTTFVGTEGASRVFGPQKGADPGMVERLEAGMERLAGAIEAATGEDLRARPGSGAAGGAAGGMRAILGAELLEGAELVLDAVDIAERLAGTDLCVTGEGRLDHQTLAGKGPGAVARAAGRAGVPAVALCGEVALGPGEITRAGLVAATAVGRRVRPLPDALAETERDLAAAGAALAALWSAAASGA